MKRATGDKRKLNNNGMTLVEVLVAIAILTVAIIPLMYSFIYVARHNAKARDLQQTSVLAYTLIENCKAYSIQEIQDKIGDGSFLPDAQTIEADTTASLATGEYLYHFDDVKVYDGAVGTSNQVYDISMRLTPYGTASAMVEQYDFNEYTDAMFLVEATKNSSNETAVNFEADAYAQLLTILEPLIENDSATYVSGGIDVDAQDIMEILQDNTLNKSTFYMNRNINVTMSNDGTKDYMIVHYSAVAGFSNGKVAYKVPDATSPSGEKTVYASWTTDMTYARTFSDVYTNLNTKTHANLQKVYMFYYPAYKNEAVTEYPFTKDTINLNNDLGREVDFYLIKQINPALTTVELSIAETTYGPFITGEDSETNLYHNLNVNLGGGSSTGWSTANVTYPVTGMDFDAGIGIEAMMNEKPKQLMYKIRVDVYDEASYKEDPNTHVKSMTTDSLASMEGTFLNW